jgi:hypothetical protein
MSCQLHVPAALPPVKSHWYPLDGRLSGPQSGLGVLGKRYLMLLLEIEDRLSSLSPGQYSA